MVRILQLHLAFLALLSLAIFLTTSQLACSCRDDLTAEEKKKKEEEEEAAKNKGKKEKAKPDFEFRDTRTVPTEIVSNTPRNGIKPGHWTTLGTTVIANNFDFQAELNTAAVDEFGEPLDIDHTNFYLRSHRPASLPKGQPKFFESTCYVPRRLLPVNPQIVSGTPRLTRLESELTAAGGGRYVEKKQDVITIMDDYQYYMIVLASSPSSYSYLRAIDTVAPRYAADFTDGSGSLLPYYRFTAPTIIKSIPVPSTALTWTSVAVVVYDDIDPSMFTIDQQQALLDWLHWGGQLIISGPRSLERLRGSFLEPYLPATGGDARELTMESFEEFNETWGQMPEKEVANVKLSSFLVDVLPGKPILGVTLNLEPGGAYLPESSELVAERWAGRGRIVATAFPLTDARIYNWRNFDNFLNNGLLRRPAREWKMTDYLQLQVSWRDYPQQLRDSRLVCNLRYFSRDIGQLMSREKGSSRTTDIPKRNAYGQAVESDAPADPNANESVPEGYSPDLDFANPSNGSLDSELDRRIRLANRNHREKEDWHFAGYWSEVESGVAGWNDFSGAADAAKQALKDAAKVKIPKADFVLKMVSLYLVVLVPVNWLIFRMIRRVEWAWIAAPIIAITAAGVVIRMAQLDIGFVRSRTDISIVELQAGFDRAHVTRYTALYTSLSTGYDLAFEDSAALSLPLAEDRRYKRNAGQDNALPISFQRDKDATMQGFQVDSSSTAWTHSEQMLTTGELKLTGDAAAGWKLVNETNWIIREVGVLQRSGNSYLAAWVESLSPQSTVSLKFTQVDEPAVSQWAKSAVMSESSGDENEVRLWRLALLATQQLQLLDGETRLIAWTDEDLPGLQIKPTSSQFTKRSLVIAHLRNPKLAAPVRDFNTQADVDPKYGAALDEEDFKTLDPSDPKNQPPVAPDLSEEELN